ATNVITIGTPGTVPSTLQLLQFNACGRRCNASGSYVSLEIADNIVASIEATVPTIVTLDEMCYVQLNAILEQLQDAGLHYESWFDTTVEGDNGGNCDYGIAVLANNDVLARHPNPPIAPEDFAYLFYDGVEPRVIQCLEYIDFRAIGVCATHL